MRTFFCQRFTCFLSNLLREVALFILVTHYFTAGLLLPPILPEKANAVLLVVLHLKTKTRVQCINDDTKRMDGWMDGHNKSPCFSLDI